MLEAGLLGLVGLFVTWYIVVPDYDPWTWHRILAACIIGPIFAALGVFVGLLIASLVGVFIVWHFEVDQQIPLVAFQDSISTGGQFYLGTGSLNGMLSYFYFEQLPNGGLVARRASMTAATVFEDENTRPYVLTFRLDNAIRGWADAYKLVALPSAEKPVQFHIPMGSISRIFSTDLK